jgi:hypothetical protein
MNRTVIFGGIMLSLIVFWLIGFVNTLHDDVDVSYGFREKALATDKSYEDEVLLSSLPLKEKKRLWKNSSIKEEMLQLFPHFIEMRTFVEENIEKDNAFKEALLFNIEQVEFEYVGGSLSGEKAKEALSSF